MGKPNKNLIVLLTKDDSVFGEIILDLINEKTPIIDR